MKIKMSNISISVGEVSIVSQTDKQLSNGKTDKQVNNLNINDTKFGIESMEYDIEVAEISKFIRELDCDKILNQLPIEEKKEVYVPKEEVAVTENINDDEETEQCYSYEEELFKIQKEISEPHHHESLRGVDITAALNDIKEYYSRYEELKDCQEYYDLVHACMEYFTHIGCGGDYIKRYDEAKNVFEKVYNEHIFSGKYGYMYPLMMK